MEKIVKIKEYHQEEEEVLFCEAPVDRWEAMPQLEAMMTTLMKRKDEGEHGEWPQIEEDPRKQKEKESALEGKGRNRQKCFWEERLNAPWSLELHWWVDAEDVLRQ
jgi:hypothetical protein